MRESTRIREAYFNDFAEKVKSINSTVPIQLSGGSPWLLPSICSLLILPSGFRSRTGMADAIHSGVCALIGLGRASVLEPYLPIITLLNPSVADSAAFATPHIVKGQWFSNMIPVKVVGGGMAIQFFYYNMRRLGNGLRCDPDASIPFVVFLGLVETLKSGLTTGLGIILQSFPFAKRGVKNSSCR